MTFFSAYDMIKLLKNRAALRTAGKLQRERMDIMPSKGNMLIAQSGGPTAAINASLSGALREAMKHSEIGEIYGARHGVEGILADDLVSLRPLLSREEDLTLLEHTPAMALGSCRRRLADRPDGEYERIREVLRERGIQYFFYIGGNDSMDTLKKLSCWFRETGEPIQAVGIPKTIDNDMACTDHTPGFGSAARYIATSVAEISCDSDIYNIPTMLLVEIMGRNAGWLTAASALARRPGCTAPHIICMPEVPFDSEAFLRRAAELSRAEKHLVIAVSEGIRFKNGQYVAAGQKTDAFGHKQLAGAGNILGGLLRERFGCKVRSVELNVLQRAAAHMASETDLKEARRIGTEAVSLALRGENGVMAAFTREPGRPYRVRCAPVPLEKVANAEKAVPLEWIDADAMDIRPELVEYMAPLISCPSLESPGIPRFFRLPPR